MLFPITDDGKLQAESDSGGFWVLFGGFAPIGKKVAAEDDIIPEKTTPKLYRLFILNWSRFFLLIALTYMQLLQIPIAIYIHVFPFHILPNWTGFKSGKEVCKYR